VDDQDASRALTLGLLDLVGPAAVIREDFPLEERRIAQPGCIHQHDDDLPLYVEAIVVVPVVLRRHDAVSREYHVGIGHRDY
jgi:hypothetical protein